MERRLGIRRRTVQGRLQIGLCLGSVNCNLRKAHHGSPTCEASQMISSSDPTGIEL